MTRMTTTVLPDAPIASATGKSRRRPLAAVVRAAGAPVLAGVVALAALTAWTVAGGAGTLARVHLTVSGAMVPAPSAPDIAAVYLTIANTGAHDDELLSVSTAAADRTMLADNTAASGARVGSMTRLSGIAVPAHATTALGPYGRDIMLMQPTPLAVGQRIKLTLHFRVVGTVDVEAMVVPLGTTPG